MVFQNIRSNPPMLDPAPVWTFASKRRLTQWYGHVHLLPHHALGQWVCIDRALGDLKWQRATLRPNTICGVDSGVIIASEMRSDGPWTLTFGWYGISLETGRQLWTSHRAGLWGRVVRLLDFMPGFTNEFRDTVRHVNDGKVFCESGRVLDVQTGRLQERVRSETVQGIQEPPTVARQFYDSSIEKHHPKVTVDEGLLLYHAEPKGTEAGCLGDCR